MGQDLYRAEPLARQAFAEADDILGFRLSELCFRGPLETLTDTINAQPAILVTSIAILRVLELKTDLRPSFAAGHSLGEFTALVCAGSLSFSDAIRLVRERGRLMGSAGERTPGGMAAILGLDSTTVAEICQQAWRTTGEQIQIANDNCPGQVVISGQKRALLCAADLATSRRARKIVPLKVSIASHSPLMAPAAVEFERVIDRVAFSRPAVPVIANATAAPVTEPAEIRAALISQLTSTVRWAESMQYLLSQSVTTFVEIGPQDVLTGLMKRIDRAANRFSVQGVESVEGLIGWERPR